MPRSSLFNREIDILILILLPLLATLVSLKFNTHFLTSALLFSGLPSLYLSWRLPRAILRSTSFALIFSLGGGLFFDYMATRDNAWYVPTLFPFRILGIVPVEDMIWAFLLVYSIVIFFQRFFDRKNHMVIGQRMKYYFWMIVTFLIIFLLLIITNSPLLNIEYFYLKGGVALILLAGLIFLYRFPKFLGSFLLVAVYFFYAGLLQELTALSLGHWAFLGENYIGWTRLLGYTFPLEELCFWLVLFSTCVLAHFQLFDDDEMLTS